MDNWIYVMIYMQIIVLIFTTIMPDTLPFFVPGSIAKRFVVKNVFRISLIWITRYFCFNWFWLVNTVDSTYIKTSFIFGLIFYYIAVNETEFDVLNIFCLVFTIITDGSYKRNIFCFYWCRDFIYDFDFMILKSCLILFYTKSLKHNLN